MAKNPKSYLGRSRVAPRVKSVDSAPNTTWHSKWNLGDVVVNKETRISYMLVSKEDGIATWKVCSGDGLDYQESVLKIGAIGDATATEGNRYLCNATGGGWTDTYIYEYSSGEWVGTAPSEGMVVFDEDTAGYYLYSAAAWGAFTTGITTIAAATDTNIAAPASAEILIWDGTNSWDNHLITGDASMTNAGVMSVSDLTIASEAQGDILRRGAAAWERHSAKTDGYMLIGDGTDVKSVQITGDVAIINTGATTVTGITLGGDAQGDVYFRGAAGLEKLAAGAAGLSLLTGGAGSDPYWGAPAVAAASSIANGATLNDAGANDAVLAFTAQTVGSPVLTIPDFADVDDTFAFVTLAQTLTNKTLTTPDINGGTADSLTGFSLRSSGAAFDLEFDTAEVLTAGHKISWDVGNADRTITLAGNIALGGTLTTLGAWTQTGAHTLGITTTNNTTITLPTTGTLATLAGAESLSSKTLTAPKILTTDGIFDGDGDEYVIFTESATPVNYIGIHSADTGDMPIVCAEGDDADRGLMLYGKGTGKVTIADAATPTKMMNFELVGATATKTMTLSSSHTDDRTVVIQDADHTIIGRDTTDTLTNKSFDCDGTGNVLTNVNVAELDADTIPAADGNNVTIMDGLICVKLNNHNGWVDVYNANAPYAFVVIDAWSINISGDGGTWKANNGAAGAGTDITDAVTVAASDTDIDRASQIDDAAWAIAASGSLSVYGDATLDAYVFLRIARLA